MFFFLNCESFRELALALPLYLGLIPCPSYAFMAKMVFSYFLGNNTQSNMVDISRNDIFVCSASSNTRNYFTVRVCWQRESMRTYRNSSSLRSFPFRSRSIHMPSSPAYTTRAPILSASCYPYNLRTWLPLSYPASETFWNTFLQADLYSGIRETHYRSVRSVCKSPTCLS